MGKYIIFMIIAIFGLILNGVGYGDLGNYVMLVYGIILIMGELEDIEQLIWKKKFEK